MASENRAKVQQAVQSLRLAITDSDLAMLADAETGLVLCTDSAAPLSHDALERIADGARTDLGASYLADLSGGEATVSVTRVDAAGWTVAMRTGAGDEIIVCRTPGAPDRAALDQAANTVFDLLRLTGGNET